MRRKIMKKTQQYERRLAAAREDAIGVMMSNVSI